MKVPGRTREDGMETLPETLSAIAVLTILMGTLSKALASCGGYVAGEARLIEYPRYTCRPLPHRHLDQRAAASRPDAPTWRERSAHRLPRRAGRGRAAAVLP